MTSQKFADLLASSELYFPSIAKLRAMDKAEGRVHESALVAFDRPEAGSVYDAARSGMPGEIFHALGQPQNLRELVVGATEAEATAFFASCWNRSTEERVLMWKAYVPDGRGVLVESTVGDLEGSLLGVPRYRIGYITYDPARMGDEWGTAASCFFKRPHFLGEEEVRLLLFDDDPEFRGKGIRRRVDLNRLVHRVRLPPGAPPDLEEEVIALMKAHGLCHPVLPSEV